LNGGALQINGGSLTLDNVTFDGNSTQSLGGAIYAFGNAVVNINDCLFDSNIAGSGAGIHASTSVIVRNTIFQNNNADTNRGGAFYLTGTTSDSLFEGVTLDQNLGTGGGGGVLFLGRKLAIDGLIATGNEATSGSGGVIAVPGTAHAKQVEIVNALFDGNTAQDHGGAISFADDDDTLDIRHSSFVSNVATGNGGALYLTGGEVAVTNDTYSGNQATDDGGAVFLFGAGLTLRHVTFSGGSANRGQGVPAICESVKIDQLYESRVSVCNSGADESNTIFKDGFESN
jgi:predicted outer membrane repeat protein